MNGLGVETIHSTRHSTPTVEQSLDLKSCSIDKRGELGLAMSPVINNIGMHSKSSACYLALIPLFGVFRQTELQRYSDFRANAIPHVHTRPPAALQHGG